ncbi:MAG TPA: nuclear transport factor 2 family protein [Anaerolineales bacterium]|nr:nuclear transport factor 2 family protein [Anaerolineales bacterium]
MNSRHLCLVIFLGVVLMGCGSSHAASAPPSIVPSNASAEDLEAIEQTALDYVEGWYQGDTERMERSLHSDMVKRIIRKDRVDTLNEEEMVNYTRLNSGKGLAVQMKNIVTILDVYDNIATVKVDSVGYIDYLHIGKVNGKWEIINVLWTVKQ